MNIRRIPYTLTALYVDEQDTLYSVIKYQNSFHITICKKDKDIHRVFDNIDELDMWNHDLATAIVNDTTFDT